MNGSGEDQNKCLKFHVTVVESLIVTAGPCATPVACSKIQANQSGYGGCRAHHNNETAGAGVGKGTTTGPTPQRVAALHHICTRPRTNWHDASSAPRRSTKRIVNST